MQRLDFEDELFEFLYNASVGFERLIKIAIVLFEHSDSVDQTKLEKSLITHNHRALVVRLQKHTQLNLGQAELGFLELLGKFYMSFRYDRLTLASAYDGKKEQAALRGFLARQLKVTIADNSGFFGTPNDNKFQAFVGKVVSTISQSIYAVISERARALNLYTYELRHGSKAESVFLRGGGIADEDALWKELLVFFMNTKGRSGYLDFLRSVKPLEFDPALAGDYLDCFRSDAAKAQVVGELEQLYADYDEDLADRRELISVIASAGVSFDTDADDLEELDASQEEER